MDGLGSPSHDQEVSAERKTEVYLEALQRIARSGENDYRRFLLSECAEAYVKMDENQSQRLKELLTPSNISK